MSTQNALPGFHRRIRITPEDRCVKAEVEDDYHHMVVTLRHDGDIAHSVKAEMHRAPWTTCPGAEAKVEQTFVGKPLAHFSVAGGKKKNCTHLYDLAELAAAHANETIVLEYDVRVSDPVEGQCHVELRKNDQPLLSWVESNFVIVAPETLAGTRLDRMNGWIDSLSKELKEPAKIMRWSNMIAHGRRIPMSEQSDATKMPPNCFTFQPEMAEKAQRVGVIYDFSNNSRQPLDPIG